MKVVGLITEYNPFHNGHKYHIEEARRITGADYVIAVMSGNFVQRGTPAVIDKYSRTEMALKNGVDLVLELPVCYATGSAEYFAHGAVALLDKLGIVDTLCFGSEAGEIGLLCEASNLLLQAPDSFEVQLQARLKEGLTYPAARVKAVEHTLKMNGALNAAILTDILAEPNNILGIEYIKAIKHLSSSIEPITIRRISAHYHDSDLSSNTLQSSSPIQACEIKTSRPAIEQKDLELCNPIISSATALRSAIYSTGGDPQEALRAASESVPADVAEYLIHNYHKTYPITEEDFAAMIKYKLLQEEHSSLAEYQDLSADLAKRLKNFPNYHGSLSSLTQEIKTKNITLTRVNRALIHLLLNIKTEDLRLYQNHGYISYARVLGIRKESSRLLKQIEKSGRIPVITKVSKAEEQLDECGMRLLSTDIFASHLYNQAVYDKYRTSIPNEYQHGICIL